MILVGYELVLSEGQVAGLAAVLGEVLGDRDLGIYRWRELEAAYVDGRGQRVAGQADRRCLAVDGLTGRSRSWPTARPRWTTARRPRPSPPLFGWP